MAWCVVYGMHKKEVQRVRQEGVRELQKLRQEFEKREEGMKEEGMEKLKSQITKLENKSLCSDQEQTIASLNSIISSLKSDLEAPSSSTSRTTYI
jgi:hypothetical protein